MTLVVRALGMDTAFTGHKYFFSPVITGAILNRNVGPNSWQSRLQVCLHFDSEQLSLRPREVIMVFVPPGDEFPGNEVTSPGCPRKNGEVELRRLADSGEFS
jgi:hypothetical protein